MAIDALAIIVNSSLPQFEIQSVTLMTCFSVPKWYARQYAWKPEYTKPITLPNHKTKQSKLLPVLEIPFERISTPPLSLVGRHNRKRNQTSHHLKHPEHQRHLFHRHIPLRPPQYVCHRCLPRLTLPATPIPFLQPAAAAPNRAHLPHRRRRLLPHQPINPEHHRRVLLRKIGGVPRRQLLRVGPRTPALDPTGGGSGARRRVGLIRRRPRGVEPVGHC
ncbi:brefeldin A-inhibited guanine nucleotide-exchange protein [Striga asiatica]|uniref:Brefeldin A-inhibited guanine nucleotide-exchange protein n=1 Tax=Striga asiatica TaxID=4170 RepID=A0A5A7Q110_STRAF|nr:brefeldin A-inhibited guanine nucleotide-exchange protein [Striga asiatica]